MGQAKRRGTYEKRLAQAIAKKIVLFEVTNTNQERPRVIKAPNQRALMIVDDLASTFGGQR